MALRYFYCCNLAVLYVLLAAAAHANGAPTAKSWGAYPYLPDWRAADAIDRMASAQFIAEFLPDLESVPRLAAEEVTSPDAALTIFDADYWIAYDVGYQPPSSHGSRGLRTLAAARGESEPLAFGVRLVGSGSRIELALSPDTRPQGCFDPADASVRLLLPWKARLRGGYEPAPLGIVAGALVVPDRGGWPLPEEATVVFVVDFHVPTTAAAGDCRLAVDIRLDGRRVRTVGVHLTVLPFRLRANGFHAGAFGASFRRWEGGFTGYFPEMIEMDARYGFDLAGGFFNKGNELPFVADGAGGFSVDEADARFARFHGTMRTLATHGMGEVLFWNWGASGNVRQFDRVLAAAGVPGGIASASGKHGFAALLAALKAAENRHGWPELVINPFDEALKDQDATREVIAAMRLVQEMSPRSRVYMTEWRPGYTRHYQSSGHHLRGGRRPREAEAERLAVSGEAPRLNFAVIGANTLDDDGRAVQDALGGEYWHYTGATGISAATRFAFGFRPWIQRSEAVLLWANYRGELDGSGWTLHHVLSRAPRGQARGPVLAGAKAYAVREGIDDRHYIETLRYAADRCHSRNDSAWLERLRLRARAILSNARQLGGERNTEGRLHDDRAPEMLRTEVANRLIKIRQSCTF